MTRGLGSQRLNWVVGRTRMTRTYAISSLLGVTCAAGREILLRSGGGRSGGRRFIRLLSAGCPPPVFVLPVPLPSSTLRM
jgi:hypothetical protein